MLSEDAVLYSDGGGKVPAAPQPVVGAANIQLATCSPNFLIQEGIETWQGFHAAILKKPIQWSEGYIIPPTEPGLGVELNEEYIKGFPYEGSQLHLEMSAQPLP